MFCWEKYGFYVSLGVTTFLQAFCMVQIIVSGYNLHFLYLLSIIPLRFNGMFNSVFLDLVCFEFYDNLTAVRASYILNLLFPIAVGVEIIMNAVFFAIDDYTFIFKILFVLECIAIAYWYFLMENERKSDPYKSTLKVPKTSLELK